MDITEMLTLQRELQEKYRDRWGGLSPGKAMEKLLWLYGELGEVGDIIKKKGSTSIVNDPLVRSDFIEEMCDVMMYFHDVLLCFAISDEEFTTVYRKKHQFNMKRWKT